MSKAILVIDMPDSCDECPLFCGHYSDMCCGGLHNRTINYPYPKDFKQDWCPLKEVPEKKDERYENGYMSKLGFASTGYSIDKVAVGYNQCIDEILGKE